MNIRWSISLAAAALPWLASSLSPSHASACSGPVPFELEAVSDLSASGPFYFTLFCQYESEPCDPSSSEPMEVLRNGLAVAGEGVRLSAGSESRLLIKWTPETALDLDIVYELRLGANGSTASTGFSVGKRKGPTDPLAAVEARESWVPTETGTRYSCVAPPDSGACRESDEETWTSHVFLTPQISVGVQAQDGWLFGARPAASDAETEWECTPSEIELVKPGTNACFVLDAWNLVDDTKHTRTVCHTADARTDEERRMEASERSLETCTEPPVLAATGEQAEELFDKWCEDRREFCDGDFATPDCNASRAECGGTPPKSGAEADDEEDATPNKPTSSSGGCSVGASNHASTGVFGVLFALAISSRRFRRGARGAMK